MTKGDTIDIDQMAGIISASEELLDRVIDKMPQKESDIFLLLGFKDVSMPTVNLVPVNIREIICRVLEVETIEETFLYSKKEYRDYVGKLISSASTSSGEVPDLGEIKKSADMIAPATYAPAMIKISISRALTRVLAQESHQELLPDGG